MSVSLTRTKMLFDNGAMGARISCPSNVMAADRALLLEKVLLCLEVETQAAENGDAVRVTDNAPRIQVVDFMVVMKDSGRGSLCGKPFYLQCSKRKNNYWMQLPVDGL